MEFESHYVTVNGLNMHYVTAGEGPPVILLHGFPDTHQIWRRQIPDLAAAGLRVIAPDLRGYGKTDMPQDVGAYAVSFLADDVLRLMDALGIDKAVVVGHDWGALIGWHLAMHAPERIVRYAALSVGHPKAIAPQASARNYGSGTCSFSKRLLLQRHC
jgi:pimeloyl-ACP methyl ester carboxylesterase